MSKLTNLFSQLLIGEALFAILTACLSSGASVHPLGNLKKLGKHTLSISKFTYQKSADELLFSCNLFANDYAKLSTITFSYNY